ncbi:imidazoleglycerol-phosphate dehydratase HisB [Pleomorphomonas sp. JP5]|uniref:imidazoleglycerol-phosphate dehydratase HisB n=1 Tax=Pleomorphomonas sp. JP5 TaxID=2942998 RepID=UPI0020446AA1|nr:imidazoleglycerol-phosphate dehydratase HisB [Pleomorphomonas sp. JP5]MCM5559579.1 imidazoleglycerol-phosphate dehydratase HisB [Pleomorphomonas sp. JP5]
MRTASLSRSTRETEISVRIDLDGRGDADISTGVGFFDHMLTQIARHGLIDLEVRAKGDLHIDDHHTVEDVGIALGQCFRKALGDKAGITRYADVTLPLDEALSRVVIDISGRPYLVFRTAFHAAKIGSFDTQLVEEWFRAFTMQAGLTLHVETFYGSNDHHIAESCFKALARALRLAIAIDPAQGGRVPSTKGVLEA